LVRVDLQSEHRFRLWDYYTERAFRLSTPILGAIVMRGRQQ
jgi:hypothetical protein